MDEAEAAGLNALFVQVRGRGDAFYRSSLAPRSPLLERQPQKFDPLKHLIARARMRRLQVHAWVNVLLAAHFGQPLPDGHVLEKHPEWAMVPRSQATAALVASGPRRLPLIAAAGRAEGDVEGYYLTPASPGVTEHLEAVVREIVRAYPVDGLHLDFIRYPGPTFDYSKAMLEGFRQRTGGGDLMAQPTAHPAEWDADRRELLTRAHDASGRRRAPGAARARALRCGRARRGAGRQQQVPGLAALAARPACCRRSAR